MWILTAEKKTLLNFSKVSVKKGIGDIWMLISHGTVLQTYETENAAIADLISIADAIEKQQKIYYL